MADLPHIISRTGLCAPNLIQLDLHAIMYSTGVEPEPVELLQPVALSKLDLFHCFGTDQWESTDIVQLVQALAATAQHMRFLLLQVEVQPEQLMLFAPLTSLVGLRLNDDMPISTHKCFKPPKAEHYLSLNLTENDITELFSLETSMKETDVLPDESYSIMQQYSTHKHGEFRDEITINQRDEQNNTNTERVSGRQAFFQQLASLYNSGAPKDRRIGDLIVVDKDRSLSRSFTELDRIFRDMRSRSILHYRYKKIRFPCRDRYR